MIVVLIISYSNSSCTTNCADCTGTVCNSCDLGFGLVQSQCIECVDDCDICNSSSTCVQCAYGFGLNTSSTCDSCSDNCQYCYDKGAGRCDMCIPGFGRTSSNLCDVCADYCVDCSINGAGFCDKCQLGYGLTSDLTCGRCDKNDGLNEFCVSCWSGGAGKCDYCNTAAGYYISFPESTCEQCPDNTMYVNGSCSVCLPGYSEISGTCTECASDCLSCSVAGQCDAGQCQPGYYLNGTECSECMNNCLNCDTGSTGCDTCVAPMTFSNNACQYVGIPTNCLESSSPTVCSKCQPGFRVNSDGSCGACNGQLSHCLACDAEPDFCSSCEQGYSINPYTNGTYTMDNQSYSSCIQCVPNCVECKISGFADCDTCEDDYLLFKSKSSTWCIPNDSATTCKKTTAYNITNELGDVVTVYNCAECEDEYAPTILGNICVFNQYKYCQVYLNDGQNCFNCMEGFGLVPDLNEVPVFPMGKMCWPMCDLSAMKQGSSCKEQLLKYLFVLNNYDPGSTAQSSGTSVIQLFMSFDLRNILDMNDKTGVFTILGAPVIYWRDDRLNWEPSMWRALDNLEIDPQQIWRPDLNFINGAGTQRISNNTSRIQVFAGSKSSFWYNVKWEPLGVYVLYHGYDMHEFPYDVQSFQFRIESWAYSSVEISLIKLSAQIQDIDGSGDIDFFLSEQALQSNSLTFMSKHVAVTQKNYNGTLFDSMLFTLTMKRSTIVQETLIFWPLFIVMVLACFTLIMLDFKAKIRSGMTILIIISVYMSVLNNYIPETQYNISLEFVYMILMVSIFVYLGLVLTIWYLYEKEPANTAMTMTMQIKILYLLTVAVLVGGTAYSTMLFLNIKKGQ